MADLIEALHNRARERARGGPSPLVALRQFAARPGARISHLGISQRLSQAWVSVTGEPFRPHQSLALSALRRGEPLALMGGLAARQTLHLLGMELLRAEAPATALLLAPDDQAAAAHRAELERLVRALGEPIRVGLAHGDELRAAMSAQLVIATPHTLHERLLRHHDRAWSALWRRLRLIMVADAHCYDGLAAPQLSWLLLRAERLTQAERPAQLAASIAPVTGADTALALLTGAAWRVLPADDGPAPAASLALWRPSGERTRELAALALGLARAGASVHITCAPFEAPLLQALVGADVAAVSVGPSPLPAQAQLLAGLALAPAHLRQGLDGAQLTVLLLGDDPAERTVARLAARDPSQIPGIDGAPPTWVAAPGNAYVSAQQLVCAAAERPLSAAEIDAWGVGSVVARLEEHRQLIRLPDPAWQPLPDGGDAYAGFDLRSAGAAPARISDDQGAPLGTLDIAAFDRWGFVGAALPPLRGGVRVLSRDDTTLELSVRSAPEPRRTLPLRRCTVRVRDQREQRSVSGRELAWGRVVLDEEVYGYREAAAGSAPAERVISPAISTSLAAPACWIDLPSGISGQAQLAGWTLVAALPLRCLSAVTDLVPAYDAEARRIYFIDAQPGGNGVSAWLFSSLEELLPLAYDLALDCRGDALLEPLARADTDWLLALLAGGRSTEAALPAPARPEAPVARAEPTLRQEPVRPPAPPAPVRQEPRREPARREPVRQQPVRPLAPPEPVRREEPKIEPPARQEPVRPLASPEPVRREEPKIEPPAPQEPPRSPARQEPPARQGPPVRQDPPRAPVSQEPLRRAQPPRPQGRRAPPATQPPLPLGPEPPRPTLRREEPPPEQPRPAPRHEELPPELPRPAPRREELPAEQPIADAGAMVARLRRLREQREHQAPRPRRVAHSAANGSAEPRFRPGDQIICTPYGSGQVRASRVEDGHELLIVDFAEHGELTIDAAVSAARLDDAPGPPSDDDF